MAIAIDIGAAVRDIDGQPSGQVSAVVVDPGREEVTHIVVRRGLVFPAEVVVPIELVAGVTGHQVRLSILDREVADMPSLEASASEPLEVTDQDASGLGPPARPNLWVGNPGITLPPLLTTATNVQPYVVERWRNVPEQSLVLRDGLPVRTRDGQVVGAVDELVTDPDSHAVTDIVVRAVGLRHSKAIPVGWIERSDEESGIVLAVEREEVKGLPDRY